jgi:hypothetical protein
MLATVKRYIPFPIKHALHRRLNVLRRFMWRNDLLPEIDYEELTGQPPVSLIDDAIRDGFCMPPLYLPEMASHDDFSPLMGVVLARHPNIVLELGTAQGNTVANICRLLPEAHVFTVNAPVEEQTGVITTFELSRDEIGCVYRAYGYGDRVTQIFANTLHMDLSQYLVSSSVDLAIVDACHDTEYVLNDFGKIVSYVKPGGGVMFHDTHPSMEGHLLGSYRACVLLRRRGYDIRHLQNTWWAVWLKPD